MKQIIEPEQYGINVNNEIMDNGERRFRMCAEDGTAYIRTEAQLSSWQNSHYHTTLSEMYIVQKGYIIFAEYQNEVLKLKKYREGEYFLSYPKVPHNLFVSKDSVIHTVKFGDTSLNDRIPFEKLDIVIKNLSKSEVEDILNNN